MAESVGRKLGKAQAPIRIAVTGRRVGPPLFEALEVLGPDRTLARLRAAADLLAAGGPPPRDRPVADPAGPGPLIPVDVGTALLAVRAPPPRAPAGQVPGRRRSSSTWP